MKKFIAILTFFLLFCTVKADTTGPFEAHLHHRVIATLSYNWERTVVIKKDSISSTDTIFIFRANCPGMDRYKDYYVRITDSASGKLIDMCLIINRYDYVFSLEEMLSYNRKKGGAVFKVQFMNERADYEYLPAIYIRLE